MGESGKETSRQKALTKLCFFIATGRNAMVVVICAVISYAFKSHGQTPFMLTGVINSSQNALSKIQLQVILGLLGRTDCADG